MQYAGRRPYGDIYVTPTTAADALSAKLYAEHQKEQQQQALELKGLDDMFVRNVSQLRDEDVPDFTQSYENYKRKKINLLKGGLAGKDRIAAEMDAQRELASAWKILNDSKQTKKALEDYTKKLALKPDDHYEEAPTLIAMTNGVPTKAFGTLMRPDPNREIDPATGQIKMVPFNPLDYNSYVDRGNVANWQPLIQKAVGQLTERNTLSKDYADEQGLVLGKEITPIKATESPVNYYNSLASAMAGTGRGRHFNNTFKNSYGEEEANNLISAYNKNVAENELWKQAWGEQGLKIPQEALLSPSTRTLALNTMAYALTHQPQLGKPSQVPNVVNLMAKKNKFAQEQQARGFAHAEKMAALRFGYSKALKDYTAGVDAAQDEAVLNTFIKNSMQNGVPGNVEIGGVKYNGTFVDMPKDVNSKYKTTIDDPKDPKYSIEKEPDSWFITKDGKKAIPLYYEKLPDQSGKGDLISNPNQKPIDIQNLKVDLGKLLLSQKQRGGEVVEQFGLEGENNTPVAPKIKTKTKSGLPIFHR